MLYVLSYQIVAKHSAKYKNTKKLVMIYGLLKRINSIRSIQVWNQNFELMKLANKFTVSVNGPNSHRISSAAFVFLGVVGHGHI